MRVELHRNLTSLKRVENGKPPDYTAGDDLELVWEGPLGRAVEPSDDTILVAVQHVHGPDNATRPNDDHAGPLLIGDLVTIVGDVEGQHSSYAVVPFGFRRVAIPRVATEGQRAALAERVDRRGRSGAPR